MARVSRKYHKITLRDEVRVGLYARLSVGKHVYLSANGDSSIENQLNIMLQYLQDKPEMEFVDAYIDRNSSGKNFHRAEFQRMLSDLYAGRINCVMAKDISRFGRNYIEVGNYLESVFPSMGIRFISVNDRIDTHGKELVLLGQVKSMVNEFERQYIAKATQISMIEKARKGKLCLPVVPYGYIRLQNGEFEIDSATADVVHRIFKLAAEGFSNAKVAKHLNDNGVLTRSGGTFMWAQSTIGQIIKNRAYLGEASCRIGGEVFLKENAHPALLNKEEFDAAQRNGQSRRRKKLESESPLVGRVICAECGRSMIRSTWKQVGKIVAGFQCRIKTVDSRAQCFSGFVLESDIEKLLRKSMETQILLLCKQRTHLKDILIEKSAFSKKRAPEIKDIVESCRERRRLAYEQLHKGIIEREAFQSISEQVSQEILVYSNKLLSLNDEYEKIFREHEDAQAKIKKMRKVLKSESFYEGRFKCDALYIQIDCKGSIDFNPIC